MQMMESQREALLSLALSLSGVPLGSPQLEGWRLIYSLPCKAYPTLGYPSACHSVKELIGKPTHISYPVLRISAIKIPESLAMRRPGSLKEEDKGKLRP